MIRDTVFFDLDGTLLPLDMDKFLGGFFKLMQTLKIPDYAKSLTPALIQESYSHLHKNDHLDKTNEQAFYEFIYDKTGLAKTKVEPLFLDFYANEFSALQSATDVQPISLEVINILKQKNYRIVYAKSVTNSS